MGNDSSSAKKIDNNKGKKEIVRVLMDFITTIKTQ